MMGWTRNSRKADSRIVEAKSGIGRAEREGLAAEPEAGRGKARDCRMYDLLDWREP
jgi:hypothetical protein